MGPSDIEDIYPLSPMQHGMLFEVLYQPTAALYFVQWSCTLQGQLDLPALQQAWQLSVEAHPMLRTFFAWETLERPLQVVQRQADLPWTLLDWRELPAVEQQARLEIYLREDQAHGFTLTRAPLMRMTLIQLAEQCYQFIWSFHHMLLDGWSVSILLNEVFNNYAALQAGQMPVLAPSRAYGEYVAWLQQQDLAAAERFWRQMLSGFTTPTLLGVDRGLGPGESVPTYEEDVLTLPRPIMARLRAFARDQRLTLNTVIQAAWALVLSRYSGEDDVLFGVTVSGRPPALPGVDRMVGLFINSLPARVQLPAESDVITWLRNVQQLHSAAREYEYSSLADVQRWSDVGSGRALFNTLLIVANYPAGSIRLEDGIDPGLELGAARVLERTSYPLTLSILPGHELVIKAMYETGRFSAAAIRQLLRHFARALQVLVEQPTARLATLSLLLPEERQQLLVQWNATAAAYPQDQTIHGLVEAQAERSPDAVALVAGEQLLSYAELNARANQLAHALRARGIDAEQLVGVCMERSADLIVALLGVLKAGGAYVPLDPSYPRERMAFMLSDAQPAVVLTQQALLERLPQRPGLELICMDTDWPAIARQPSAPVHSAASASSLAYVIYTSGSTGQPKGVMIEHQSAVTLVYWARDAFPPEERARVVASTSICFDLSVFEIFVPLSWGGQVLLLESPLAVASSAAAQEATMINTVPSAIAELLRMGAIPRSVRTINLAGEALQLKLVQELYQLEHIQQVVNLYGPSEDTTYSTMMRLPRDLDRQPPIGRPIANTQVCLLDRALQPVPWGVPGELYLGGAGLARGYLRRPALTEERFIANPLPEIPSARLYRTGDLARYLPDGTLEFLGRIDQQVKIRGFRIEPAEIEHVLRQHTGLLECAVVVREDQPGEKRLVAYGVPRAGQPAPTTSELRAYLAARLPEYMVPAAFIQLEALPLTPNGKLDRTALPAPGGVRPELAQAYAAPQSPTELALAAIWSQLLGIAQVGLHDNFFELGGHSLLATSLLSHVQERFGRSLSLRQLFQTPTIAGLAALIDSEQSDMATPGERPQLTFEYATDARLDPAIVPAAPGGPAAGTPAAILLTGASGFLGSFLLHQLLCHTSARIYCLVRAAGVQEGQQRLRQALAHYGLYDAEQWSRVVAVPGDLARPRLGLSTQTFETLAQTIDLIYHNGAAVNMFYPYSAARVPTVLGTQELLQLACQGKTKPFHHISTTAAVVPADPQSRRPVLEQDRVDVEVLLDNGYTRSKWVAEQLVLAAQERGLPVNIYRCGRIFGASQTGICNESDWIIRMLKGCLQLGLVSDLDHREDILSVDYVSEAIVYLSLQPAALGTVFHFSNPQSTPFRTLIDAAREHGFVVQETAYTLWRQEMLHQAERNNRHVLHPLAPFFPASQAEIRAEHPVDPRWINMLTKQPIDCRNTTRWLQDSGITAPAIDAARLRLYIAALIASGFLEAPQPVLR